MLQLLALGLRVGLRGNGFRSLLLIGVLVIGLALLASSFSGRQPLTVGLDVGLSGVRVILLLMTLLWVQDLLGRDIERKTLYFMLAYPYSRAQFLFSRFAAVAVLAAIATLLLGIGLVLVLQWLVSDYKQLTPPALDGRYALVLLGIWLDLLVVAGFALLLCTLSTTPFLPLLLGLAFALAARGLGPTLDYLRHTASADPTQVRWFTPILEHAYAWLPDLSRLDWRALVLYDLPLHETDVLMPMLMAGSYVAAILALAALVFQRRNFT